MSDDLEPHLQYFFNWLQRQFDEGNIPQGLYHEAITRKHYEAGRRSQKMGDFREAAAHYRLAGTISVRLGVARLSNMLKLRI